VDKVPSPYIPSTLRAPRCGDCAKLLHQAHAIHLAPMFHTLAISNAEDVDHPKGNTPSGWWNAHKLALVGAAPGLADYHFIAFGDNIVDRGFEIWEGAAQHSGQLFYTLTITRYSGREFFVFNEVVCHELVDLTHVSLIEDFLHHLTNERFILFS
jgi:hypothetical protein